MKHWEILKNENIGKKYKDNKGVMWEVSKLGDNTDLYNSESNLYISTNYILSRINELEFEEVRKEDLKYGDKYFYLNVFNIINETTFKNSMQDDRLIEVNNCYPYTQENEEEVLKEVILIRDRKKLKADMEIFARENNTEKIDWNDFKQRKYHLFVSYKQKEILIEYMYGYRYEEMTYYTSREVADRALEKFGQRLKELYIDVEE